MTIKSFFAIGDIPEIEQGDGTAPGTVPGVYAVNVSRNGGAVVVWTICADSPKAVNAQWSDIRAALHLDTDAGYVSEFADPTPSGLVAVAAFAANYLSERCALPLTYSGLPGIDHSLYKYSIVRGGGKNAR